MAFFERIRKFFIETDKSDLRKQESELSKGGLSNERAYFELSPAELEGLKSAFKNRVIDLADELKDEEEEPGEIVRLVIAAEFLKIINNGRVQATILDSNHKILKELSIEEFELNPEDIGMMNQLSKKRMDQKIDSLAEQLDYIIEIVEEINKRPRNDRYAKVNDAIGMIKQSYLEEDDDDKKQLEDSGQAKLHTSMEALLKKIEDSLAYFKGWDSRSELTNNYSVKNINKSFNQLMKDYLFFTGAKSALIELKQKQGMSRHKLFELTENLDKVDRQFKEMNMEDWLPPLSQQNGWQHRLFKTLDRNHQAIVIDYALEEFFE